MKAPIAFRLLLSGILLLLTVSAASAQWVWPPNVPFPIAGPHALLGNGTLKNGPIISLDTTALSSKPASVSGDMLLLMDSQAGYLRRSVEVLLTRNEAAYLHSFLAVGGSCVLTAERPLKPVAAVLAAHVPVSVNVLKRPRHVVG